MSHMSQLHVERCDLTYEGFFVQPGFSLIDAPGKLCDLLLDALASFQCTAGDLTLEEGEPEERGITCELDEITSRVSVHGDRIELHCDDFEITKADRLAVALEKLWSRLAALSAGAVPKTHSFLFELDTEIRGLSYQDLLNGLARPPDSLPPGTETAVGYYLPGESGKGYAESSLVFNRSAAVEHGLQVNATLVFEGAGVKERAPIPAAWRRLDQLLRNLGFDWTES